MYSMETTIPLDATEAEKVLREALAAEGFGIINEIDFAAIINSKLGTDRQPLKVLGACNPQFANDALDIDPTVALLLPCNISLSPNEDGGTIIRAVDPRELMSDSGLAPLAKQVAEKLRSALDTITLEHGYTW